MNLVFLMDYSGILICDIIIVTIPILMYLFPKRDINFFIGYRTPRSMKNQKTWDFSQRFYFKKWLMVIPLVIIFPFIMIGILEFKNYDLIESLSMGIFLIYSIILIFITERRLIKLKE